MAEAAPLPTDQAEALAGVLKLLGNANRLAIVCLLAEGERTVAEIEATLGIRQPSLSQQLGVLREGGLIRAARAAKTVTYALEEKAVTPVLQLLCERLGGGPLARPARPRNGHPSQAAVFATVGERE
jgi:DNA-binding transcriptional ArsR family regulator